MKINKCLSSIAFFLLSLSLLLSIIDFCCFDLNFYKSEYEKDNTAEQIGMDYESLIDSTSVLLDYLRDNRDDIVINVEVNNHNRDVFNERETQHMVDVKNLYQNAITIKNIIFIISICLFIYQFINSRNDFYSYLKFGYKNGISLFFLFLCFLMIWIVADFDGFWTSFHRLFFDNDLWLLDPNTSIMINMFPSIFFEDLVIKIIMIFAISLLILGLFVYRPFKKLENR